MRVNELKLDNNILGLLTELFSIKGAKEIFEKYNIEMVTEKIEKEGLANFIKQAKNLFEKSKTVEEYKQATSFLDAQINSNKTILNNADGFMKTMIESMITSFETTKQVSVNHFTPLFQKELKELLHNIVNEEDKKTVEKYIEQYDITKLSEMLELVKSIELTINSRYHETERKVTESTNTVTQSIEKETEQVEQNSLFETEEKPKRKKEHKQETKEEPKQEIKEPDKPKVESKDNSKEEELDDNDLDDLFSDEDFEEFLDNDIDNNEVFDETTDDLDF